MKLSWRMVPPRLMQLVGGGSARGWASERRVPVAPDNKLQVGLSPCQLQFFFILYDRPLLPCCLRFILFSNPTRHHYAKH